MLQYPTIILKFEKPGDEVGYPDIFISSLEDSINAVANDYSRLEEIKSELTKNLGLVDMLQNRIRFGKNTKGE